MNCQLSEYNTSTHKYTVIWYLVGYQLWWPDSYLDICNLYNYRLGYLTCDDWFGPRPRGARVGGVGWWEGGVGWWEGGGGVRQGREKERTWETLELRWLIKFLMRWDGLNEADPFWMDFSWFELDWPNLCRIQIVWKRLTEFVLNLDWWKQTDHLLLNNDVDWYAKDYFF